MAVRVEKCPACKVLHKKCKGADCLMLLIHKTFTGNYLTKWMAERNTDQERRDLITTLAWEASQRKLHPISGSHGAYMVVAGQKEALVNHNNILKNEKAVLQLITQQLEAQVNEQNN
ncbi:hypothetical protein L195_g042370 [Trifolium pratense]|uniref:Uncharacterized protein n=2 Tax=Trifolium pratense TaxID=57577 RepID=A0ACB0K7K0_TRIPR|nr:hypothetical protein L195_g042370 [Trifolium pratense]CAJ2653310.1 unnamed protein product [Trifolium pratense]